MFLTVLKSLVAPSGRAKAPTVDAIRRALAEANAERIAATNEVRQLEESRLLALVDADRRAAHTAALAAARQRAEDAALAVDELQRRLAEAEAAETEAERRRRYDDARARRDALARSFEPRYREHIEGLLSLLRETAEVDAAADAVNDALPADADPIPPVEAIRDRAGLPRKIKSKTTVELWASPHDNQPIPDGMQSLVKEERERGELTGRGFIKHHNEAVNYFATTHYVRKTFEKTVFLDSTIGEAGARLRQMPLFAFRVGEPDHFTPRPYGMEPSQVLSAIERAASQPIEPPEQERRELRTEYRPIPGDEPAPPPEPTVPQSYLVPDFGQSVN
jgi:hypothetical protein